MVQMLEVGTVTLGQVLEGTKVQLASGDDIVCNPLIRAKTTDTDAF